MSPTVFTTVTHTCPLPTTNTLDSQQRARLIRSTRKLGALLGTTPYLLEGDGFSVTLIQIGGGKLKKRTPTALKRQGSIFSHHQTQSLSLTPSSSMSSLSLHTVDPGSDGTQDPRSAEITAARPLGISRGRSCRAADKPRPLYLRLNPVPVSPTDTRFASFPPSPTGCPPTSDLPSTPCTPNFSAPDPADVRRKRMAKLTRHLGENIPPELVPPTCSIPKRSVSQRHRQQSMSVSIPTPNDTPFAPIPSVSSLVRDQDWVGHWNRSDIRDVQKELRNLRTH